MILGRQERVMPTPTSSSPKTICPPPLRLGDITKLTSPNDMIMMLSSGLLMYQLIVLGFNDTSTLVGHFVSSPREREKSDRRDSRRDERQEQGRKRNRNESEETEEIKTFPLYPYLLQG